MLLNKYQERQKEALATQRKLNDLCRQKWSGAWVPCLPFQHGWIRDWELRPDIAARKDAGDFRSILRHIGTNQWCSEKEFHYRRGRKVKRSPWLPLPPPSLKPISIRFDPVTGGEIGWPDSLPQHLKKYFYYHPVNAAFCNCFRRGQYYRPAHYTFRTPWMFQLRIRPAFIDKLPLCDGGLESQIVRLEQHMQYNQFWPLIYHMRGRDNYDRGDARPLLLTRALDQELKENLLDV